MLERYVINWCNFKFIFRGLSKTRDSYRLRASGSLSYSHVRELVLEKLIALGLT